MTELLNFRTRTSKTFDLGNGQRRAEVCSGPIHYKRLDVPQWTDISLTFGEDLSGVPKFLATEQAMTVGTRLDGLANKMVGLRYDHAHQFEQTPVSIILSGVERLTGNFLSVTQIAENQIAHNIAVGVDYIHDLRWTGVRGYVKVLNAPTSFFIRYRFDLAGFECCNLVDANGEFIPDANNAFHFADVLTDEWAFCLRQPIMWDELKMSAGISHRLYISGGFLYYEKASTLEGEAWLATAVGAVSIDATVEVNGSAGDGRVYGNNAVWATQWSATTANAAPAAAYAECESTLSGGQYYISRAHFFFTLALSGTDFINSVTLKLTHIAKGGTSDVMAMKSTSADPIVAGSYDDFTGASYGNWALPANEVQSEYAFNATGIADLVQNGVTKICVRNYTYDYLNSAPAGTNYAKPYTQDETVAAKRPLFSVVYTPAGAGGGSRRRRANLSNYVF